MHSPAEQFRVAWSIMMQPINVFKLGMLQPPYHTAAGHYEVYVTHTCVHWDAHPGETQCMVIHRPLVEPGDRHTSNSAHTAKGALLQLPYHSHEAPMAAHYSVPTGTVLGPAATPKRHLPPRPTHATHACPPPTPTTTRKREHNSQHQNAAQSDGACRSGDTKHASGYTGALWLAHACCSGSLLRGGACRSSGTRTLTRKE